MPQIPQIFGIVVVAHPAMITFLAAIASLLSFRIRGRASLELEVIVLRHQLAVLKRQRPGRAKLFCADRLLWVLLYRIRPRAMDAMILVKPTTVLQWHRRGFRLAWRWRSWARRPGRLV
jgi:putative transposase